jgi:hypothetical protein
MKRAMTILLYTSLFLLVCTSIAWFIWSRRLSEFNLGDDLHHALGVLDRVRIGERRCFNTKGMFVPLQDLGSQGCGGIEGDLSTGAEDGFEVEVHDSPTTYSVRVHPRDTSRFHSLFSDQTGTIHFGTRDRPATAETGILVK